jgi:electron transfer flavoprotein alpha subunit
MSHGILVWAEQREGRVLPVVHELLGKGQELAEKLDAELNAFVLGENVEDSSAQLLDYGCTRVFCLDHPVLSRYQGDAYTRVATELMREEQPEIVLWGATVLGTELAARVAAQLRTGLTAHCIDLDVEEIEGRRRLVQLVPGWGGNMLLKIVCHTDPQMATVKPGLMSAAEKRLTDGQVIRKPVELGDEDLRTRTLELVQEEPEELPLEEADVVVAGGWGMNALNGFGALEELAHLLGAAIGGTRPAADKGWVSESKMIGQSGTIVAPRLFISVGASGASQYTTGFEKADIVLAIDRNRQAPIFEQADIGIVGKVEEILPQLVEALHRKR